MVDGQWNGKDSVATTIQEVGSSFMVIFINI